MTALILVAILTVEDTPKKTVEAFVKAFNAHDAAGMSRRVVGQKSSGFPMGSGLPTLKATLGMEKIDGDTANVEVDVEATGNGGQRSHETVNLRRVGGDWQIVPSHPPTFGAKTTRAGEMIGILAYFVSNPALFAQAKGAARRSACLSNVKQLAIGTLMYTTDHNETFPKTSAGWKAAIMPYVKNERIFHCPEDTSGGVSYFFDPRIAGKSMSSIPSPAFTAMIVEGTAKQSAFRHGGKATLGYADAHVKISDRAQVAKARTVSLK